MIVFVDTSAILAVLSRSDGHHRAAVATWKWLLEQGVELRTTDLVVAEAVVLSRARGGFAFSVKVGERLLRGPFGVAWVDERVMSEAWALYKKYADQPLSLCDCASFAVMRRERIPLAFSYDRDFEHAGFTLARAPRA